MTTPPPPLGENASAAVFSATRAMADVREIGLAPHPPVINIVATLLGSGPDTPQAVRGPMPWVAALPLALLTPLVCPLIPPVPRRNAHALAALLRLAACGIALKARRGPVSGYAATCSRANQRWVRVIKLRRCP